MIFGKTKQEFKVGIFVFVGLVILMIFVLLIGNFKTMIMSHRIDFLFNFTNGVKVGAPIRFAGVDIGEVKDLIFPSGFVAGRDRIRIIGWVRSDVKIPLDSTVWVNTLGLLGEKYIEIIPGKDYSRLVQTGGALYGTDPLPMQDVFNFFMDVARRLDQSIQGLNDPKGTVGRLLHEDTIYKELESLITDVRKHPWKLFWKTKAN